MKRRALSLAILALGAALAAPISATAQATAGDSAVDHDTPNKVESRIGPLFFKDGMPSKETLAKVYDNLDFTHAFEAFVNTMQGVNAEAIRKGFADIGVKDNELLVFSKLMDAKSLFLTANADTVYFVGGLDLSEGPDGARDAAEGARHDRRRVVALGHRLRRAGPRPRRGRQVSDPAARLRRSGARRRVLCLPRQDEPRAGPRPHVHGEETIRSRPWT